MGETMEELAMRDYVHQIRAELKETWQELIPF